MELYKVKAPITPNELTQEIRENVAWLSNRADYPDFYTVHSIMSIIANEEESASIERKLVNQLIPMFQGHRFIHGWAALCFMLSYVAILATKELDQTSSLGSYRPSLREGLKVFLASSAMRAILMVDDAKFSALFDRPAGDREQSTDRSSL